MEEETWNVINSYFEKNKTWMASHQINSYNDFVNNKIPSIFKSNNLSFLLDGFPRSITQANLLLELMKELDILLSAVILIDVEQPVLINRIINRKSIEGRNDDNEEVLASRLKIYYDQTAPLIQFYKDSNLLKWVNGVGEISDINQQINCILDEL